MTTFLTSIVTPAAAIYLANLAIAAVLISTCGLLAVLLFSRQSAPVRHAILVSTLILTLLAPGLTWWACRNGWGARIAISFAGSAAKRLPPAAEAAPEKDPAVKARPRRDISPPDAALPALPFALHLRERPHREQTLPRGQQSVSNCVAGKWAAGKRAAAQGIAGQSAGGRIVAACRDRARRMGMAVGHANRRGPRRPRFSRLATIPPLAGNALARSP